ncbi:MAG: DUF2004 domain-containing protein [Ferruginibacter sp.]
MAIKLPYFGIIDASSLNEYYDTTFEFNGRQVNLDLNFDNGTIDIKRLETVNHFIENIRIHDLNNKKHIQNDFDDKTGDTVRSYIENHLEDIATDDLEELIGSNTKTSDQPKLLLKQLHLVRVGLYPDSETQFATFDYSIGRTLTDYLVVLVTDENGNLDYITMES